MNVVIYDNKGEDFLDCFGIESEAFKNKREEICRKVCEREVTTKTVVAEHLQKNFTDAEILVLASNEIVSAAQRATGGGIGELLAGLMSDKRG